MSPNVLHTTYSSNLDIGIHCYRTTGTYPCVVLLLDYIQGTRLGRMTYCYYQGDTVACLLPVLLYLTGSLTRSTYILTWWLPNIRLGPLKLLCRGIFLKSMVSFHECVPAPVWKYVLQQVGCAHCRCRKNTHIILLDARHAYFTNKVRIRLVTASSNYTISLWLDQLGLE
jgi:hypothetical protein